MAQTQQPPKRKSTPEHQQPVRHFTTRNPPWTYLQLQLITHSNHPQSTAPENVPVDPLTTRTYLTSALSQFLGLTGTAISIDILKIIPSSSTPPTSSSASSQGNFVWIRTPRPDAAAVVAALSSWIGSSSGSGANASVAWRVCAKGNFLGAVNKGDGGDLFVP